MRLIYVVPLLLASSAWAEQPKCYDKSISEVFPASNFFIQQLTPGQYHFVEGVFFALPSTEGLPPGDKAFFVTDLAKSTKPDDKVHVVFTKNDKKTHKDNICMFLPAPRPFLAAVNAIKDGPGEEL